MILTRSAVAHSCFKILGCFVFFSFAAWCAIDSKDTNLTEQSNKAGDCVKAFPDQQCEKLPFYYANPDAPKGGTVVLGSEGSFDTLYSFFITGKPCSGTGLIYATLCERSKESSVTYPYVAESVEISPTEVSFILRPSITFHDGSPITPEDVIFSFKFITKNSPFYNAYYHAIKEAKKTGPNKVTFFLNPDAANETALIISDLPVLSKAFFEANDTEKKPFTLPMGSGPYRITEFEQGKFVKYEKVPNFWGDNLLIKKGYYNFQYIKFEYYKGTDQIALFEAFKKGEIDFYLEGVAKNWATGYNFAAVIEGKIKKESRKFEGPVQNAALIFNTRRPLFQDIKVRQALSMMMDFNELNKSLFFGSYSRITSIFANTPFQAKGLPSEEELTLISSLPKETIPNKVLTTPIEDFTIANGTRAERAKQALILLSQAGWELKQGTLTHKETGKPFQFTFLMTKPILEKVLLRLQGWFATIGVKMAIKPADPINATNLLKNFDFDMCDGVFAHSAALPGNELVGAFGAKSADIVGSYNLAGIKNKSIDEMIRHLLPSKTYEELMINAKVLDRLVMSQYYVIPKWYMSEVRFAYWDKFGQPKESPKSGVDFLTWWSKETKIAK